MIEQTEISTDPCSLIHTILVLKWSKLGCTSLNTCIKLKFTELVNFADQGSRWTYFVLQTFTHSYQILMGLFGFGIE